MLKSKINAFYEKHNQERICLGDILRDFSFFFADYPDIEEVSFPYLVIFSQECDIDKGYNYFSKEKDEEGKCEFNQFLPNILLLPAFYPEEVKNGDYLLKCYKIQSSQIGGELWKKIKENRDDRYHFLPGMSSNQIPELVLDFKIHYTIPFKALNGNKYNKSYIITINELFRERLAQRFFNYIGRIGTPKI